MDHLGCTAELLESHRKSIFDDPYHSAPRVQTIQHVCTLEVCLSLARQASAEKAPDLAVEGLTLLFTEVRACSRNELGLADGLQIVRLRPLQDLHGHWDLGDEVALDLALPLSSFFDTIKSVLRLRHHLVVVDALVAAVVA